MTAYKLVPLEATQKMIEAGNEAADIYRPGDADMYVENMDECYRAMIAAAPDPEPFGWFNVRHGTFFSAAEIPACDRTDELLATGELIALYATPRTKEQA